MRTLLAELPAEYRSALEVVFAENIRDESIVSLYSVVGMFLGGVLAMPMCLLLAYALPVFTPPWAAIITVLFMGFGAIGLRVRARSHARDRRAIEQLQVARARFEAHIDTIDRAQLSPENSEQRKQEAIDRCFEEISHILANGDGSHG